MEVSVSFTPWLLYAKGRNPDTGGMGGWVGSRAVLNVFDTRIFCPFQEPNLRFCNP